MNFSQHSGHIPRCQHIKTNGTQCGSPALRRKRFCFFHNRWRATRLDLNRAGALRVTSTVELPVLEDADSIQVALMQVLRLILCRQLDSKTGGLMLYGLQIASANVHHLDFEHRRKTNVIIDPRTAAENGVGHEAWSLEDFPEDDDSAAADADLAASGVARAPSLANAPISIAARNPSRTALPESNESDEFKNVQRIESALQGARQGNWRDLKTVFKLAGIFPLEDKDKDKDDDQVPCAAGNLP
jgi:hypothetical protein